MRKACLSPKQVTPAAPSLAPSTTAKGDDTAASLTVGLTLAEAMALDAQQLSNHNLETGRSPGPAQPSAASAYSERQALINRATQSAMPGDGAEMDFDLQELVDFSQCETLAQYMVEEPPLLVFNEAPAVRRNLTSRQGRRHGTKPSVRQLPLDSADKNVCLQPLPAAEDWKRLKPVITKLYRQHGLDKVMQMMSEQYKIQAKYGSTCRLGQQTAERRPVRKCTRPAFATGS